MPVRKSRYSWAKLYRPSGMRYTSGTGPTVESAIADAWAKWHVEFGPEPRQEHTTIELFGVTAAWACSILEIKD